MLKVITLLVTNKDVTAAIDDLLEQNKVFFQREVEQLTELRLNFLRALANGVTTGLSRKVVNFIENLSTRLVKRVKRRKIPSFWQVELLFSLKIHKNK